MIFLHVFLGRFFSREIHLLGTILFVCGTSFEDSYFHVGQFRQAVLIVRCRRKTSIFVRKALHIRPRDRNMRSVLLARREGCALFDEDGVYDGLWNFAAACLNGHLMCKELSLVPLHAAHAAHIRAGLARHIAGIKFPVDLPPSCHRCNHRTS